MKKLVSLIMVLALVLGLATVAFAEGEPTVLTPAEDSGSWSVNYNQPGTFSITLPDSCTSVYVRFVGMNSMALNGYAVNISSKTSNAAVNNDWSGSYGRMPLSPDMGGNCNFSITSGADFTLNGESGDVFTVEIAAPPIGTFGVKDALNNLDYYFYYQNASAMSDIIPNSQNEMAYDFQVAPPMNETYNGEYYYSISLYNGPYYFTISDIEAVAIGTAVADSELKWSVALSTEYGYADVASDETETSTTVGLGYEGGTLIVSAGQYDKTSGELVGPAGITFTLSYDYPETGSELQPIYKEILETPDFFQTVSIPSSKLVEDNYYGLEYTYYGISLYDHPGAQISIEDSNVVVKYNGEFYTAADDHDDNDQVLTVNLAWYTQDFEFAIANLNDTAKRFVVNVDMLDGYFRNPVDLVVGENKISFAYDETYGYYYNMYYFYEWTAPEAGILTLSDLTSVIPEAVAGEYPEGAEVAAELEMYLNIDWDKIESGADYELPFVEEDTVTVAKGDVITLWLYVIGDEETGEYYPADISFTASFMTEAEANPIRVNVPADLSGIDVPAGGTVYYSINSQLNGQILTIAVDENAVVTLNGKELKAENGVVAAELTGTPTNKLVVTNKGNKAASYVATINWPVGSESNPIEIKNSNELTGIDAAAGESVYYAINSQLNGQILTINVDDKTVVTLNGKEVKAEDGVVTATLEGTPVNVLVVTNKGEKDASYTASIAYELGTEGNPIAVTTEKELNGTEIAAGEEVHYLLNSKMAGTVLSVKGDKAYVIVNGEKTEAKDGFIKLTLEAKGATISLVIGNAGEKAATVTLGYSDNPNTGDAGIMAPIAMALVSAMSTVALVIKKKEF